MSKDCDTCRYEEDRGLLEETCNNCDGHYSNWKEKTEPHLTLEDYLKQREDLDKKIEEIRREDKKELLRATQIDDFYDHTLSYPPRISNLEHIVEHSTKYYIKVSDLLTAIEEGRLKIDENI